VLIPSFDPGRQSMLLLPITKACSSVSVGEEGSRGAGVMTSAELTSAEPEVLGRGKRDCVDKGESAVKPEDRNGRGMLVSE